MCDLIRFDGTGTTPRTEHAARDDWSFEDGLFRLELEGEILFVPRERVHWIRRRDSDDE